MFSYNTSTCYCYILNHQSTAAQHLIFPPIRAVRVPLFHNKLIFQPFNSASKYFISKSHLSNGVPTHLMTSDSVLMNPLNCFSPKSPHNSAAQSSIKYSCSSTATFALCLRPHTHTDITPSMVYKPPIVSLEEILSQSIACLNICDAQETTHVFFFYCTRLYVMQIHKARSLKTERMVVQRH